MQGNDTPGMVMRWDISALGKAERTPQGGVRVPAALTRVGVFPYRLPDGTVRREFRPPEEVFAEDSMRSLRDATVTDLHPPEMIRPNNYRKYGVGHVKDDAKADADQIHVRGTVVVQDADTIAKIDSGARKEVSMGYGCILDPTPGEYNGEKYDAIQRNIRYNHVALGPSNWGRQGSTVSLRLDSADAMIESVSIDSGIAPVTEQPPSGTEEKPMKIRFDGKEYEAGSQEHLDAIDAKHASEKATLTARADAADGKIAVLTSDLAAANTKIAELEDPKRLDSLVSARVELVSKAAKSLGSDYKFDGKSDLDVMVAVLTKADPSFKADGRSVDYIRGMFDTRVTSETPRTDSRSLHAVLSVATTAPTGRDDAAPLDADKNRQDMRDHNRKQASEPFTLSK